MTNLPGPGSSSVMVLDGWMDEAFVLYPMREHAVVPCMVHADALHAFPYMRMPSMRACLDARAHAR